MSKTQLYARINLLQMFTFIVMCTSLFGCGKNKNITGSKISDYSIQKYQGITHKTSENEFVTSELITFKGHDTSFEVLTFKPKKIQNALESLLAQKFLTSKSMESIKLYSSSMEFTLNRVLDLQIFKDQNGFSLEQYLPPLNQSIVYCAQEKTDLKTILINKDVVNFLNQNISSETQKYPSKNHRININGSMIELHPSFYTIQDPLSFSLVEKGHFKKDLNICLRTERRKIIIKNIHSKEELYSDLEQLKIELTEENLKSIVNYLKYKNEILHRKNFSNPFQRHLKEIQNYEEDTLELTQYHYQSLDHKMILNYKFQFSHDTTHVDFNPRSLDKDIFQLGHFQILDASYLIPKTLYQENRIEVSNMSQGLEYGYQDITATQTVAYELKQMLEDEKNSWIFYFTEQHKKVNSENLMTTPADQNFQSINFSKWNLPESKALTRCHATGECFLISSNHKLVEVNPMIRFQIIKMFNNLSIGLIEWNVK